MDSRCGIRWLVVLLLGTSVQAATAPARAHEGSHQQLARLDARIAADPMSAELYLKRGRVYFQDDHWDPALADYERAAELGLDADLADLVRGELYLEAQWPQTAKLFLDRLLGRRPDHSRALLLRARARAALERPTEAADDYVRALESSPGTSPDLYLEVVRGLARAERTDEAVRRADEALELFGPLASLAHEAVELEVAAGHLDSALARLAAMATKPGFRERWLLRRAEVLEMAERPGAARAAYEEARDALQARPAHRRGVPALVEITAKVDAALRRFPAWPIRPASGSSAIQARPTTTPAPCATPIWPSPAAPTPICG